MTIVRLRKRLMGALVATSVAMVSLIAVAPLSGSAAGLSNGQLAEYSLPLAVNNRDAVSQKGLLLLTASGELLTLSSGGELNPSLPYLPAIKAGRSYEQKLKPDGQPNRLPTGQRVDLDGDKWVAIEGLNYNALGSGVDGVKYAMLKIDEKSSNAGGKRFKGHFQAYQYTPGEPMWRKFGDKFALPEENTSGGLAIQAGAVNPVDKKYYFGTTGKEGRGNSEKRYFYLYRLDNANSGAVYLGKTELEPYVKDGHSVASDDGDMVFTAGGDLVIGASAAFRKHPGSSQPSVNVLRMQVVRKTMLDNATGDQLVSIKMPAINFLESPNSALENSGGANGFTIGEDGSLVTSHFSRQSSSSAVFSTNGNWSSFREIKSLGRSSVISNESKWDFPVTYPGTFYPLYKGYSLQHSLWNTEITDMAGGIAWIPSIQLNKNVVSRLKLTDQFKMTVEFTSGKLVNVPLHEAMTSGTETGLQTEFVGPIPLAFGDSIVLKEELVNGGDLGLYSPELQCVNSNGETLTSTSVVVSGSVATATLSLNQPVTNVSCTFVNGPKYSVKVSKIDSVTKNKVPGAELLLWKDIDNNGALDKKIDQIVAGNQEAPNPAISADGSGQVIWKNLAPGKYLVEETQEPQGYLLAKDVKPFAIKDKDVAIEFENSPFQGAIEWQKVDMSNNSLAGSEWLIKGPKQNTISVVDNGQHDVDPAVGKIKVDKLPAGSYKLTETKPPVNFQKSDSEFTFEIKSDTNGGARVQLMHDGKPVENNGVDNAIVNTPKVGALVIEKVDSGNSKKLSGSEWQLTGPKNSTVKVADCISTSCDGFDKDPEPGMISVQNLPLGSYTLTETKAPSGYKLDTTPYNFTLNEDNLKQAYVGTNAIKNSQQDGPALPRSGGVGRDFFFIAGGGVMLLALAALALFGRKQKL
ncbi:MSCRAMM family protein [Arcanobacterium phocae]|uniref:MSCRAMM family protein n=1 Tax=Arcanobacterium phocae TaxID=131112 RepID=UPI001C111644